MKNLFVYVSTIIIVTLTLSCGKSSGPKHPSNPATETAFCKKIQSSTESVLNDSGIKSLIEDICKNTADIENVMYKGETAKNPIVIEEKDNGDNTSYVYYQGGLSLSDVSPETYFEMVKHQALDDGVISGDDYSFAEGVSYNVVEKSDSEVIYDYDKQINIENNTDTFSYKGVANFFTIEKDTIYVATSRLSDDDEHISVNDMYSVSIIVKDGKGSKIYAAMSQTADNHNQHDSSVKEAKKFFKKDQENSYHNAEQYNKVKN